MAMDTKVLPYDNLMSHTSRILYVDNLKKSIAFYESIGFICRDIDTLRVVIQLNHCVIELYDNQQCKVDISRPDNKYSRHQQTLIIYMKDHESLKMLHDAFKALDLELFSKEIDNDSSPLGCNFTLNDPDNNRIAYSFDPYQTRWFSSKE